MNPQENSAEKNRTLPQFHRNLSPPPNPQNPRRIPLVHAQLQKSARPDNRKRFPRRPQSKRRQQFLDLRIPSPNRELRVRRHQSRRLFALQIRNQIPKIIQLQNYALDRVPVHLRLRNAEAHKILNQLSETSRLPVLRKPPRHRRENIPPMKSIADRLAKIMLRRDVPRKKRFG